jgi:UDP-N-acetylmuramoyl-L-alanyl-D-glutamate--2,6-diaminopimelate ligase
MIGFIHQTLADLFKDIPVKVLSPGGLAEVPVTSIAFDSRAVQLGSLFVALVGDTVDGHRYIPSAIEHGAVAVVGSQSIGELPVPYVQVEDTRYALAHLSAAFYSFPARHLTMIGVTGTDGKTTTANLIFQILLCAGFRAGIISTINAVIGDEVLDTGFHVTTPEAPDVQRYLARMVDAGLTHVVLESTSHGLAQHRVTACEFDVAVVTNITHEHLDYHGTYEAYRAAKARLFTGLKETRAKKHGNPRLAVLNRDDQSYEYLSSVTHAAQVGYSLQESAGVWAKDIRYGPGGIDFIAAGEDFRVPIHSDLVGAFNVSNILAAIAATVVGLDIPDETAARGIAALGCVPGRMERIDLGQDFTAIVDFAHTPNALQRALETVRQMTPGGRILAVFGSAGLRDRQKRRLMAEVSAKMADLTFLTAEDPRTESLDGILSEMAEAAVQAGTVEGQTFWRVPDRGEAIRLAVQMARPGDLVITCGKGHEQSMCFGVTEYPWDDRIAMQSALAQRLGVTGPKMPYLPTQGKDSATDVHG